MVQETFMVTPLVFSGNSPENGSFFPSCLRRVTRDRQKTFNFSATKAHLLITIHNFCCFFQIKFIFFSSSCFQINEKSLITRLVL